MDSYIFFLKVYKKYSTFRIARNIYGNGDRLATVGLWLGKFIFAAAGVMYFFFFSQKQWAPSMLLMLSGGGLWGISFQRALRRYVSTIQGVSQDKANLFRLNYQYLRYHLFAEEVKAAKQEGDAGKALVFINGLLETEHSPSVWSNPFVATMVAVALAVLGGAAGTWDAKYVIGTICFSIVAVYFASVFLATRMTKEAEAKELKRFLFWMTQVEGEKPVPAPSLDHQPVVLSMVQKNNGVVSPDPGIVAKTETPREDAA